MTASTPRSRHLLALALASTTVLATVGTLAAGTGVAAAATHGTSSSGRASGGKVTKTSTIYSGSADSSVVQIVLTLPSALAGPLGAALPNPLELDLIRNTGQAIQDGSSSDVATSVSDLGAGSLVTSSALGPVLQPILSHTVTATLADPTPTAYSLGSVPSNPLGLNLALTPLTATTDPTAKSTQANGGVANGSLGSLATLAPQAATPLKAGLDQVNTGLQTAISALTAALTSGAASTATATSTATSTVTSTVTSVPTVGSTLTTALGSLPTVTVPATPVSAATTISPTQLLGTITDPTALTTTLNNLPALIAKVEDDLINGAVLSLAGATGDESVTPAGTGTTSAGDANVATLNLFGGLVQVQASKASATASSPGTAGNASSDASATLVKVQVGNDIATLLTALADDSGVTAGLLGTSSPLVNTALQPAVTAVNTALQAVLTNVTGLLSSLNSNAKILQQGTATHSVSSDGTHAEAHATPAEVSLGVPGATDLVRLSLGKVDVVANRQVVTTTTPVATKATTTRKTTAKPVAPTRTLAFTGANLPVSAGAALILIGTAAGLARRRRSAQD